MDDELKAQISEIFAEIPVDHGEFFDDGRRRWCGICRHPRIVQKESKSDPWKSRACPECSAIWPEHAVEFMSSAMSEEDFLDQFPQATIN